MIRRKTSLFALGSAMLLAGASLTGNVPRPAEAPQDHLIQVTSAEGILYEADMSRIDWLRPIVGNIDLFAEADQEFGGRDYGALSVALGRAGITHRDNTLLLQGMRGRVAGFELPASVIEGLPQADNYILSLEMRLTNLDAPGYYMGPRINRGHGRGFQRFLNREIEDWQTVEFFLPNSASDTGAVRLAHYGGVGDWEIRRLYIRHADERDDFPWALDDNEKLTPITVRIDASDATPANPYLHGFNPNFSRTGKITFDDPEIRKILQDSGARILRFPTGTQSNWYDWRKDAWPEDLPDTIPAFVPISARLVRESRGTYGQDAYIEVIKDLEMEPVLVLNILTQTPESMVSWLQFLEEKGVPVRYLELGNETYHDRQANESTATGSLFVEHVRPYVEAIRKEFPDVKFSAPVISRAMRGDGWEWNEQIGQEGEDVIDAVTLHTYSHAFGVPFNREMIVEMLYPDELNIQSHIKQKEKYFPGLKIWNTEWNINAPPVMPNDSQLGAMQNALYLLSLIRNEEHFEMATLHSLSSSDFSPVKLRGHAGTRHTQLKRAFFAQSLVSPLFSVGSEWLATTVEDHLEPFEKRFARADAQAGRLASGEQVVIVINRLPVSKPLQIDGITVEHGRLYSLTSSSLADKSTARINDTLVKESDWKQGDTIPPYSINRLVISR